MPATLPRYVRSERDSKKKKRRKKWKRSRDSPYLFIFIRFCARVTKTISPLVSPISHIGDAIKIKIAEEEARRVNVGVKKVIGSIRKFFSHKHWPSVRFEQGGNGNTPANDVYIL